MSHANTFQGDERRGPLFSWERLIGWVVAALLAWGAVEARVRVLEDRYERVAADIAEMKGDVKALIRQVRP